MEKKSWNIANFEKIRSIGASTEKGLSIDIKNMGRKFAPRARRHPTPGHNLYASDITRRANSKGMHEGVWNFSTEIAP